MCVVRLPETGQHSAERAALDFIVPHPDAFIRYQYLQHAHRRRLVAQGHHPAAHGADDPVENYKQVLKALKCVPFSSTQMGDVMRRRRKRLAKRLRRDGRGGVAARALRGERFDAAPVPGAAGRPGAGADAGPAGAAQRSGGRAQADEEGAPGESLLLRNLKRTARSACCMSRRLRRARPWWSSTAKTASPV
ncbi:hypothetical protein DVH05_009613 [Phytophthora capsici]|nr:hypothetical protein DVH05_009613 [Phytophthora capsici]